MDQIVERLERVEARLSAPPRAYLPVAEAADYLGLGRVSEVVEIRRRRNLRVT